MFSQGLIIKESSVCNQSKPTQKIGKVRKVISVWGKEGFAVEVRRGTIRELWSR